MIEEIMLRATTPVLINSYEQLTFLRRMIEQLLEAQFKNIIVLDQGSEYPPLLDYLREGEEQRLFTVCPIGENMGPRWFFSTIMYEAMPEKFFYSDPDLSWPEGMALDLVSRFIRISEEYKIGKVGSALTLPEEDQGVTFDLAGQAVSVRAWEEQFWLNQAEQDVYMASIDTTFHLVNKKYFSPKLFFSGARVAGDGYECKHLPWYSGERSSAPEFARYAELTEWSQNIGAV